MPRRMLFDWRRAHERPPGSKARWGVVAAERHFDHPTRIEAWYWDGHGWSRDLGRAMQYHHESGVLLEMLREARKDRSLFDWVGVYWIEPEG